MQCNCSTGYISVYTKLFVTVSLPFISVEQTILRLAVFNKFQVHQCQAQKAVEI